MSKPTKLHWVTIKHVLCFLVGTMTHGIFIRRCSAMALWRIETPTGGGDTNDRWSRTGFLVYVGGSLISWSSRKQGTVTCSSMEAEYRAIATTTQEVEAVRFTLQELGVLIPFPLVIFTDNLDASFIARNLIAHICLDLHFVREQTEKGEVIVNSGQIFLPNLFLRKLSSLQANLIGAVGSARGGGCVGLVKANWMIKVNKFVN